MHTRNGHPRFRAASPRIKGKRIGGNFHQTRDGERVDGGAGCGRGKV